MSLQAATINVYNRLANGYSYDPFSSVENCPSGYTINNIPSGYHTERPHVIYNSSTGEWVLWAHYDNSNYTTAEALVATSSTECGPYTIYQEFQPLGEQVRDDYVFKDSTGTAYFIAASNKNGGANDTMAIWRLTSDYLNVDSSAGTTWVFENQYREAPIAFQAGSVYYLLTSQAAGWFPSQGGYATSSAMLSGWSALNNLGNSSTFGGQESGLLTFSGSGGTAYILVLDHLGGNTAHDDGAMWLPLSINASAGTATLEWYTVFSVDTSAGTVTLPSRTDLATSAASASSIGSGCAASSATDQNYGTEWCASGNVWPSWWQVDLGSLQLIDEIDTSWYMVKGSEAYYQYQILYSNDGSNWTTIDRTGNQLYGFTNDRVNIYARYLKLNLTGAVLQNNPNNWYTPAIWEVKVFTNTTAPITGVPVKLISKHSGLCLDVYNNSTQTGGSIDQWACNGGANQDWTLTSSGNNQYEIVARNSGLALEDPGYSTKAGTDLDQWTVNNGSNQHWTTTQESSGDYALQNVFSGYCADVYSASTSNGALIDQWTCAGSDNQAWRIVF